MSDNRIVELQERGWRLQAQGKLDDAVLACSEALQISTRADGGSTPDAANLLNDLAEIECDRQDFERAMELAEQTRQIEEVWEDGVDPLVAAQLCSRTLGLMGEIHRINGDYGRAEEDLLRAVHILESEFGKESKQAADARNNLAVLYKYWGRFDEGLWLYQRALRIIVALHGGDCLEAATVYHNIGGILHSKGDYAAAEQPARKAWKISQRLLGREDPRTQMDAVAYAAILDGLERYDQSEAIYRAALRVFEGALGREHYEVAAVLHNLAAARCARGARQEAESLYRRSLAIKEKLLGADNPDIAVTCNNLGDLLSSVGRHAEAELLLERAVNILKDRLLPGHPDLARARTNLNRARVDGCTMSHTPEL